MLDDDTARTPTLIAVMLSPSLDPADIGAALPKFRHYFRYPLHAHEFHELRVDDRLHGYYACKPLYGRLDAEGRVDRSAGFNGDIAGIYLPSPVRNWRHVRLFFTRLPRERITRGDGKRDWPAIRAACEMQLRLELGLSSE